MKKILFALTLITLSFSYLHAQKTYTTRNAVVHFRAADDDDIDAVNNAAVSRLQSNGELSFIMLITGFKFEMETMKDHFNKEYIESDKFPRALFNGKVTNIDKVDFTKDGKYPINVTGNMQVHGVNKSIQTTGLIEIKGGIPTASARFTTTLKDFGIGGILIKMVADKINIDVTATYQ